MPKFKLTPDPEHLNDPIWMQSELPHEACYVGAESEQEARDIASSYFRPMTERVGSERIVIESPWLDREFTTCDRVAEIGRTGMPHGLVQRESEA